MQAVVEKNIIQFNFVECQRYGDVAVLLVNDPPANTLTYDLVLQLEDAFFELSLDTSIRAVVISGAGERFFSGGVNIGMLRSVSPHYNSNFILYAAEVFERINTSSLLVVAAINGHATGGGLEVALIADKRVAVDGVYNLGFPEVRLGVIPGLGGTQRLARLVGPHMALELITHGDFIPVARAKELGIVDRIFPKEDFLAKAVDYARALLSNGAPVVARPVSPHLPWRKPNRAIVSYARSGRVGVITIDKECGTVSSMHALWALNQAILEARLDDGTEAVLLAHSGDQMRLGADPDPDAEVWGYAQYVFQRLENFPRLCVLAFKGSLNSLASELALACDYRFIPHDVSTPENELLSVPKRYRRLKWYGLEQGAESESPVISIHYQRALDSGLVKQTGPTSWPQSVYDWIARFVSPRGASKAIGYAKLAVVKGTSLPIEGGMLLERHLQEQLFRSHDGPEGMKAYLEKRAAVFKGD